MAEETEVIAKATVNGKIWTSLTRTSHGKDFIQLCVFQRGGERWLRVSSASWGAVFEFKPDDVAFETLMKLRY